MTGRRPAGRGLIEAAVSVAPGRRILVIAAAGVSDAQLAAVALAVAGRTGRPARHGSEG
ncbi:MAG TPA: hypothetical protein VIX86_19245 [Streptosporangiaceae bacterium]